MRTIEFRGKRLGNIWVYGDLVHLDRGCIIITSSSIYIDDSLSKNNALVYSEDEFLVVIPETVGEFTGLKDKNGKKIFEGDILRTIQGIAYVIWDDAAFALKSPGSNAIDYEHSSVYESSEIIGNIYDNSEILESNK